MSKIVSLFTARHSRAAAEPSRQQDILVNPSGAPPRDDGHLPAVRQHIYRSILLIELAVQYARLLPKEVSDPAKRLDLETQIAGIESLLQHARKMALEI